MIADEITACAELNVTSQIKPIGPSSILSPSTHLSKMLSTFSYILMGLVIPTVAAAGAPNNRITLSGNYTPTYITCPLHEQFVRAASEGLSASEEAWLDKRRPKVVSGLKSYLHRASIEDFDIDRYIEAIRCKDTHVPVIAMTLSGGGDRAKLAGLGMYRAIDGRDAAAVKAGTGGLLQAMTYIAGRESCMVLLPHF